MKRLAMLCAIALLAATAPVTSAQAIALIAATPQLQIDTSVPSSAGFNAKTHPFVRVRGVPEGETIGGYVAAEYAHQGTLANGETALAIPLDSGGSGGIFTQLVFARTGTKAFTYAGHIDSGGHLAVAIEHGAIVATLPYYGPNDPNCCPSKTIVQTYTIDAGKLRKRSEKTLPAHAVSPSAPRLRSG